MAGYFQTLSKTVVLNGEVFATGKIDTAQLLEKLTTKFPELTKAAMRLQNVNT